MSLLSDKERGVDLTDRKPLECTYSSKFLLLYVKFLRKEKAIIQKYTKNKKKNKIIQKYTKNEKKNIRCICIHIH